MNHTLFSKLLASVLLLALASATEADAVGSSWQFGNISIKTMVAIDPASATAVSSCTWFASTCVPNVVLLGSDGNPITLGGGGGGAVSAPTTTTLGGVFQATAPTNQFQTGIGSTGAPTFAQPSFSNLSGTVSATQMAAGAAAANLGFTPATLASPTFTGVPAAPTATAGTNTTQVATTQFVTTAVAAGGGVAGWAGTWTSYTPTMTFTGGTSPVASAISGSFSTNGKTLFLMGNATIGFSTAPTMVFFSLPSGICNGFNVGSAYDLTTAAISPATCFTGATAVTTRAALSASGQVVAFSTTIQLQ